MMMMMEDDKTWMLCFEAYFFFWALNFVAAIRKMMMDTHIGR